MTRLCSELSDLARKRRPRLVVFRSGALGDSVLLLPTLRLLDELFRRPRITWVGSPWARGIQPLSPVKWEYAPYDSAAMTPLFGPEPTRTPDVLRAADAILAWTSRSDSPFADNLERCGTGTTLVQSAHPSPGHHMAVHLATPVCAEAPSLTTLPDPVLRARRADKTSALKWLGSDGDTVPQVVVHPGSGSDKKCWPPDRFADLCRRLIGGGTRVTLLVGPADRDACKHVAEHCDGLRVFKNRELGEVAGLLASAEVCVTNDSGIGHFGAALGTGMVSVFGPTDPAIWRPLGPCTTVVESGKPREAWPPVQKVLTTTLDLIQRLRRSPASPHLPPRSGQ